MRGVVQWFAERMEDELLGLLVFVGLWGLPLFIICILNKAYKDEYVFAEYY